MHVWLVNFHTRANDDVSTFESCASSWFYPPGLTKANTYCQGCICAFPCSVMNFFRFHIGFWCSSPLSWSWLNRRVVDWLFLDVFISLCHGLYQRRLIMDPVFWICCCSFCNSLLLHLGLLALHKPQKSRGEVVWYFGVSFLNCFSSLHIECSPPILVSLPWVGATAKAAEIWNQIFHILTLSRLPRLVSPIYRKHRLSSAKSPFLTHFSGSSCSFAGLLTSHASRLGAVLGC
jgi:hypothetical protein